MNTKSLQNTHLIPSIYLDSTIHDIDIRVLASCRRVNEA
jgi:hypothetical protein